MHEELKLSPSAPGDRCAAMSATTSSITCRKTRIASPASSVQQVFVRDYPEATLAAHVAGYVGEINEDELKEPRYRGLQPGDEIGKEGVEDTYDRYLRGQPGADEDPGERAREPTPPGPLVSKPPIPGETLKLTLDSKLQAAGRRGHGGTAACRVAS